MIDARQGLLEKLIAKLIQVIKDLHSYQSFPFGDFLLNRQQVMILFFVSGKKQGAVVKDLAAFLRVTSGAITQFIDVLVNYKLVKREEVVSDRRLTRIKLSNSAKKKFEQFKINYFISTSRAFKDFQTEELEQFIKLLEKIK
ncbi:MAG: winged helix DNA-binding protein [Patescibacteria group bacterium]|jgi:DNA-binding MarR family transcriptional regulator